jgi:rRNA-processing protein FCF1
VAELPTKILCDTNFLLVPLRFGVDIFTETDNALNDITSFYVSSRVLDEINLLRKDAKPSLEKELLFAFKMAELCSVIEDPSELLVDDSLIQLAKEQSMVLGTTDSELRKKARLEGVKVIYLRQRRYLVLDG